MNRPRDPEFEAWIEEARSRPILDEAVARGTALKGGHVEKVGPCPACGGRDRFSVNLRKSIFFCRSAQKGGDVIALVQYLDGVDFMQACEILTGRPPPRSDTHLDVEARRAIAREQEKRARDAAERQRTDQQKHDWYRERERRKAYEFWRRGVPAAGTPAEAYLQLRGLELPAGAHLRYAPEHPMFASGGKEAKCVHRGPAMLAAITNAEGRFLGLHATWIDLSQPNGKACVAEPETGEIIPSKKVRGSQSGGRIVLVPYAVPYSDLTRLIVGEGIETVLSVWLALREANSGILDGCAFWSSVNLGNLAGKAKDSVKHPTLKRTDKLGRERAVTVPGPMPDLSAPTMPVPDSVREMILLGDGDSDPFTTRAAIERAGKRYARRDRVIRAAFSPEGSDFNDMRRAVQARSEEAA
jgi:hypothetical protein